MTEVFLAAPCNAQHLAPDHPMSNHFTSDNRGIIVSCASCGTANRIAYARLGQQGRCGTCQTALPAIALPVDISSAAGFAALISQSPLPVVVDFWAAWCGPCKMMAPEFAKAAGLASGDAVFVKVNTEELPEIASQFRIQGIPAFALIRQGKPPVQTSGFQPAHKLLEWVRGVQRYNEFPTSYPDG